MASITLDYESIRSEATNLRSQEEQIKGELTALRGKIAALVETSFVTQHSSGAFQQRFEDFKAGADQTISSLSDLASQLEQIVANFAETDQSS